MEVLAQCLGIKMGHDCREDFGRPLLDGTNDAEQHPAGDTAPTPIASPRLAFEVLVAVDLAVAQGPWGQAKALGFAAPPARPGPGKPPEDGFICIEHNALASLGSLFQGGQGERSPRQLSGVGSEPPRGTAVAYVFFFHTSRTLSRLSWPPVWRASTVASS